MVQKYRALCAKTPVSFTVAGDIKLSQTRSLRVKWYQAVRIAVEV